MSPRAWLAAAGMVATVVASLVLAGPASAHSVLESSDPANGSSLTQSPPRITLTFNEALQEQYDVMTVVGPDGNFWQSGDATVVGARLSVPLRALGPAGTYTTNYRVTSADGHPVQGRVTFTLTVPGTGTPGPTASDSARTDDDNGVPLWPFVVAVIVLVAAGGTAVVFRRRSRM